MFFKQRKAAEKREKESKVKAVQVDDLLTFRQFSKKNAVDGADDVCCAAFNNFFMILTDVCYFA